jgi:thioredoxin-related protein
MFLLNVQKKYRVKLISLLIFGCLGNCFISLAQKKNTIKWIAFEQLEMEQAKKRKKVLIEVYAKDCEWCQKLEKEILNNPVITNYINLNFYSIKVEAFDKTPIRFNNKELLSTNGFHPITAEFLKGQTPLSFPTLLFFDEKFTILNFLKGYNTAKNLELAVNYFGGNYYKTQNWDEFLKNFKGQIK